MLEMEKCDVMMKGLSVKRPLDKWTFLREVFCSVKIIHNFIIKLMIFRRCIAQVEDISYKKAAESASRMQSVSLFQSSSPHIHMP